MFCHNILQRQGFVMAAVLDTLLDGISTLSLQDQELLDNILHKRIIDEKRDVIVEDYEEAVKNLRAGNVSRGTVGDLFNEIEE